MSIKNRKLQVFVSSTFTDLREERQAAVEAILSTGNIPAGMELFAAGDQSQMEVIKEWIQESDVYLLILGGRYGAIEPISGKSYTHLEYEYALEIGKPHFAVVTSEAALNEKVKKHGLEMTERGSTEKYNGFKKLVTGAKLVEFWNDLKGIELAIHKSLGKFSKREELVGWIRGDQAVDGGALAEEMVKLNKENRELKMKISENGKVQNALDFDAIFEHLSKLNIESIFLKQPFFNAYQKIKTEYLDANAVFFLIQNSFNGLNGFNKEDAQSVLSSYIRLNLINYEVREVNIRNRYGESFPADKYFPRLSLEGVNYLLHLERHHPEIASQYLESKG